MIDNVIENSEQEEELLIDIHDIMKFLPHRFPFLLVDKVVYKKNSNSAVGVKNVTVNEFFFLGHFPKKPIMPGVLILESLAQTAGILVCKARNLDANDRRMVYFSSIEGAKFRKIVLPGDQLILETRILKSKLNFWKINGIAKVNNNIVAEATFSALLEENND